MTKSLGLRDNPLGLDFKFLNPGSASAEAEAEEHGSPLQRRGAGSRGPGPPCAPPSGWGHCRPRSPLRPPPAPGARGRCVRVRDSRPHPAPTSPGPQAPCAPRPAQRVLALDLHLGTESLQEQGLPRWMWCSGHWALRGIWGFRRLWLPPGGGGEPDQRRGTRPESPGLREDVCLLPLHPTPRMRSPTLLLCCGGHTPSSRLTEF